jgi:hypothetical protein
VNEAPSKSAPSQSVASTAAPSKNAPRRSALLKFAHLTLQLWKLTPWSFAPLKFELENHENGPNDAPFNTTLEKSVSSNCVPGKLRSPAAYLCKSSARDSGAMYSSDGFFVMARGLYRCFTEDQMTAYRRKRTSYASDRFRRFADVKGQSLLTARLNQTIVIRLDFLI